MFSNIGKKIMNLATVTCVLGMVASVIYGLTVIGDSFLSGFLIIVVGMLASWISSFVMFGLGRLIDNTSMICYAMGHPTEPDFEPNDYSAAFTQLPPLSQQSYTAPAAQSYAAPAQSNPRPTQQAVPAGGWKCKCGRVHMSYVTSCVCGVSKSSLRQ